MSKRTVRGKNKPLKGRKRKTSRRDPGKRFAQLETELQANKARWEAVVANPFMGITVLGKTQHFVAANSTFQTMVGYSEAELKKLTPLDITPALARAS